MFEYECPCVAPVELKEEFDVVVAEYELLRDDFKSTPLATEIAAQAAVQVVIQLIELPKACPTHSGREFVRRYDMRRETASWRRNLRMGGVFVLTMFLPAVAFAQPKEPSCKHECITPVLVSAGLAVVTTGVILSSMDGGAGGRVEVDPVWFLITGGAMIGVGIVLGIHQPKSGDGGPRDSPWGRGMSDQTGLRLSLAGDARTRGFKLIATY